jgi:hypothetical protein
MSIVSFILTHIGKIPSVSEDIIILLTNFLGKYLTLKDLMHLRIACNAKPSAEMLAFALQNSLPYLVGLNMNARSVNYYLQIASSYFDPSEPSMYDETMIYHHIARNGENQDVICVVPVYGSSFDFYIKQLLRRLDFAMSGKKKRALVEKVLLRWRADRMGVSSRAFIDRTVEVLHKAFILDRYGDICAFD